MSGCIPGVLFVTTLHSAAEERANINTCGGEAKEEKEDTLLSDREHIRPQAVKLCGRRDGSRSEHCELRPFVLGQCLGERTKLPTIN
jgi:hypothetical protein